LAIRRAELSMGIYYILFLEIKYEKFHIKYISFKYTGKLASEYNIENDKTDLKKSAWRDLNNNTKTSATLKTFQLKRIPQTLKKSKVANKTQTKWKFVAYSLLK
jgi:hypothetical protein